MKRRIILDMKEVPLSAEPEMQETLYNTESPQKFISEYYEIIVLARPGNDSHGYMFIECHGWWDESEKRPKNDFVTKCPEDGMTIEEAEEMYLAQRVHRARGGFIYSFTQNPFGFGPRVIKL